ncbi:MAG: Uma2 family endonuclease [Fimbriimonadia bacterium]|nr:Uma2 family endonuclease [Fimbriimonadia bacterium]
MGVVNTRAVPEKPGSSPIHMSFEDYLDWLTEDTWAEWVDGDVIQLMAASDPHQAWVGCLYRLLDFWSEHHHAGIVRLAPFPIKLTLPEGEIRGRKPDIFFIAQDQIERKKPHYFEGAPDLIVEVISRESRQRDRGDKYFEYEAAGVKEYWLVDPERRKIEFYQLQPEGAYDMIAPKDGLYHSLALPGFWLKMEWLWQEPRSTMLDILKQWELI